MRPRDGRNGAELESNRLRRIIMIDARTLLIVGIVGMAVLGAPAVGIAAEAEDEPSSPLLRILFAWAPFIFIIVLWVYFMRRMRVGTQVDRSLAHMEKLERQTGEVLATLQRIEQLLRERR
jgi:hypothetical protein